MLSRGGRLEGALWRKRPQYMQAVLVDTLNLDRAIIAFNGNEKLDNKDVWWQH